MSTLTVNTEQVRITVVSRHYTAKDLISNVEDVAAESQIFIIYSLSIDNRYPVKPCRGCIQWQSLDDCFGFDIQIQLNISLIKRKFI